MTIDQHTIALATALKTVRFSWGASKSSLVAYVLKPGRTEISDRQYWYLHALVKRYHLQISDVELVKTAKEFILHHPKMPKRNRAKAVRIPKSATEYKTVYRNKEDANQLKLV